MKLKDLYSKPINRAVNPAVSATKFDPETERIEIQEYVFTDEIINGLFRILDAIKNNKPYDHVGIWIDGYFAISSRFTSCDLSTSLSELSLKKKYTGTPMLTFMWSEDERESER